jgi:8-oxo-dGTP diphosphatase
MEQNTTEYVAGFMFSYDLKTVALIKKNRPSWQAGKLNGIGGHVEPCESPVQAMVREFEEETGLKTDEELWFKYARISENGAFAVSFFVTQGFLGPLQSKTDEEVVVVKVSDLNAVDAIENIPWLVHLAIDNITDGRPEFCEVTYPVRRAT